MNPCIDQREAACRAKACEAASRHAGIDTAAPVPTSRFALLVGVAVLPLYASQVLIVDLDASLHLGAWTTLVTACTMLGYALGLVGLVPLVDRLPNRPLVASTLGALVVSLLVAAAARHAPLFLAASFAIGVTASAIQMLVPAAASLAPPAARGRVVGNVMSGLMLGILLSRPFAGVTAHAFGWRGFYFADAVLLAVVATSTVTRLPELAPTVRPPYRALIASLAQLVANERTLRRHALQQGLLMAGFNTFWSSVAVVLARAPFSCSATQIALFALAGAGGVAAAPIAGRSADRGHAERAKTVAHCVAIAAALGVALALGSARTPSAALVLAAVCAFFLDAGVIADQTLGRRAVNLLPPEIRGRVNGLYTGLFFVGSACGAALAGPALAHGGWPGVCLLTFAFFAAAAALHRRHLARSPAHCPQ
jgi:predicted MFS family arabinose efflux permease